MKVTAIEIDGVRYEPCLSENEDMCDECDMREFCKYTTFGYTCAHTIELRKNYKRVKE